MCWFIIFGMLFINFTERTSLEKGEITKRGFIELNEMEAEDSQGDVEDLWITLTSMGLNKALIMDEVSFTSSDNS